MQLNICRKSTQETANRRQGKKGGQRTAIYGQRTAIYGQRAAVGGLQRTGIGGLQRTGIGGQQRTAIGGRQRNGVQDTQQMKTAGNGQKTQTEDRDGRRKKDREKATRRKADGIMEIQWKIDESLDARQPTTGQKIATDSQQRGQAEDLDQEDRNGGQNTTGGSACQAGQSSQKPDFENSSCGDSDTIDVAAKDAADK